LSKLTVGSVNSKKRLNNSLGIGMAHHLTLLLQCVI
jgi:hypothetical protein